MRLYVVSLRTKLVTLFCIAAFLIIAVVSSDALTDKNVSTVNHFGSDELKVPGVSADQWASTPAANPESAVLNAVSGEKPEMDTENQMLFALVAAAAIGEAYPINVDPDQAGEEPDKF